MLVDYGLLLLDKFVLPSKYRHLVMFDMEKTD